MAKKNNENNLIDMLLDKDNHEPIVIYDENNKELKFQTVAVIPFVTMPTLSSDKDLYVIMKPIDKIEGVEDDEVLIFVVDYDFKGQPFLAIEHNQELAQKVYEEYVRLLDDIGIK